LAARHAIPAIYSQREFPDAGGLLSYGTHIPDLYRQVGLYAGKMSLGLRRLLAEKLVGSGGSSYPRMVRTRSLRTELARHRVDHGTICGRSCANSGHYKPLCAVLIAPFQSEFVGRRPENLEPAPRPGAEFWPLRLFAFELRRWRNAARAYCSGFSASVLRRRWPSSGPVRPP
jgi:hypothetical protein